MYNYQTSLFYDYQAIFEASGFYRKYQALFSALDLQRRARQNSSGARTKAVFQTLHDQGLYRETS